MGTLTVDNLNLKGSGSVSSVGRILQVVQTSKTDDFSTTSTSYTDVTGFSATITPSSTSSKVLVMAQCQFGNNAPSAYAHARLVRGSTAIHVGDSDSSSRVEATVQFSAVNNSAQANVPIIFLDSPLEDIKITRSPFSENCSKAFLTQFSYP